MEPLNFQQICRICLSTKELVPIFETVIENEMRVSDMVPLLQLEWHNMDLPQNVCSDCISELYRLHKFSERASKTEIILKRALKLRSKNHPSDGKSKVPQLVIMKSEDEPKEEELDLDDQSPEGVVTKSEPQYYSSTEEQDEQDMIIGTEEGMSYMSEAESLQFLGECEQCNEIFESYEELRDHEKNEHQMVPCAICNKKFTTETIRFHMATHSKEKPLKCIECNKEFWNKQHFKRHMMVHTGERPYKCQLCGKGFIQWTSMQKHKMVHARGGGPQPGRDSFDCQTCGRTFKRILAYNYHLKKHGIVPEGVDPQTLTEEIRRETEARSHICEVCGKGYKSKYLLKAHTAIHGEKKFFCTECGKAFVSKPALQAHQKVHTGEKPHKCAICHKSFAHISTFDAHALIHTGVKPFACKHCPKMFTQPSHLNYHMRVHSGERPFKCQYCDKAFALKGNLVVHERTHTGETPYVCDVCDRGFYDSSSMKKHRRGHMIGNVISDSGETLQAVEGAQVIEEVEGEQEGEVEGEVEEIDEAEGIVYEQNGQYFIEASVEGFE